MPHELKDHVVKVDDVEYEIDITYSYSYPSIRESGIAIQIERVTMLSNELDIDPEEFQSKLSDALMEEITEECNIDNFARAAYQEDVKS